MTWELRKIGGSGRLCLLLLLAVLCSGVLFALHATGDAGGYTVSALRQAMAQKDLPGYEERLWQELEQAGYLEKVSVSGRKEKPLRLTESGKRYTADKLCGLYRAEERAAAAMGAEQFAAMVEMTRKFTDSFEKEIRNGAE